MTIVTFVRGKHTFLDLQQAPVKHTACFSLREVTSEAGGLIKPRQHTGWQSNEAPGPHPPPCYCNAGCTIMHGAQPGKLYSPPCTQWLAAA